MKKKIIKLLGIIIAILCSLLVSVYAYTFFSYKDISLTSHLQLNGYSFIEYVHMGLLALIIFSLISIKFFKKVMMIEKEVWHSFKNITNDIFKQLTDIKFLIGVIILFVAIYGFQISNFTLSLDEEFQMAEPKSIVQWCYEGRFSIAILKSFFMEFGMFQPYLSNFIGSIFMLMAGLGVCYLFDKKLQNRNPSIFMKFIFLTGFLSFPSVVVESMSFSTYCIEVALGIYCIVLSVIYIDIFLNNNKLLYFICSIFLLAFALGIYQAMAGVYISLVSIYFLLKIINEQKLSLNQLKDYIKQILKTIYILILGLLIFFALYKFATFLHKVDTSIEYINGFSGWDFNLGIGASLYRSLNTLLNVLNMFEIPGIAFFSFFTIIGIVLAIYILFYEHNIKGLVEAFLLIEIIASAYFMWIFLAATSLPFRAWLAAPFVCGFVYFICLYYLTGNACRMICVLCQITLIILAGRQVQTANQLFYNDHIRMEKDITYAKDIYHDICYEVGIPDSATPIVFVGTVDLGDDKAIIKNPFTDKYFGGDALGYSLWRRAQEPRRMRGLYMDIGYELNIESCTDGEMIEYIQEQLTVYPSKGSIKEIDGKIYVRLE